MKFENYSKSFLHFHTQNVPEMILKYLPEKDFALADLGAGDGAILVGLQLGKHLDSASRVVAVDISKERCDRLSNYTDFEVLCSNVTNIIAMKPKAFDFIICTQVIEHVDEESLLNEIKRLLSDNGKLYIASVIRKKYGWWYYKNAEGKWSLDPTHLREYPSQEAFEEVIKKAGLVIKDVVVNPLKLSVLEFLIRRVIVPIFKCENINEFFLKHKFLDFFRRKICIHPLGYYIIEVMAKKH